MAQRLCSECGKKITGEQTYYWLDIVDRLRIKCKSCFMKLSGKSEEEVKELDDETVD